MSEEMNRANEQAEVEDNSEENVKDEGGLKIKSNVKAGGTETGDPGGG